MKSMVKVVKKVSGGYVKNAEMIRKIFPKAVVLDVTEDGLMGKFDPGFPVGRIKAPGMEGEMGLSFRGIWEGLKVFSKMDKVDGRWLKDERKLRKKREFKSYGNLVGIRIGKEVVDEERGMEVFEEVYKDYVKERFRVEIEGIVNEVKKRVVVLLDYEAGDGRKWMDHAEILKRVIEEKEVDEKEIAA